MEPHLAAGALTIALAAGATTVALAFAGSTYEKWLERRRRHQLTWSIALLLFACGSASLWAGATLGWNEVTFRFFYTFGAVLNVPVLALGTIYLLAGPRRGDRFAVGIGLSLAFAAGVIAVAPFNDTFSFDPAVLPQGSDVFGPLPRVLAALASGLGALVVFGGALWSAARLGRKQLRLIMGNLVIALGTAVLSMSGLLNSLLGEMDAFAVTLTAGIVVLFVGFLISSGKNQELQNRSEDDGRQQNRHSNSGSGSHESSDREDGRSDTDTAAVVALFGESPPLASSSDASSDSNVTESPTSRPNSAAAD